MTAPRVSTPSGAVTGVRDGELSAYLGVPFAAPPVGALRWRPPEPPAPWTGVRAADRFAPAPLQPQPPRDSIMYHANFADRRALVMSEDCLYLNVWTPAADASARLPVMVWVHGGGYRYGHGSQEIHNGAALARRGLVVVTLNHRLGALGYLVHPELAAQDELGASGNYGLMDIVAALTWVRDAIAGFGGDPAAVTLAGNSAGAAQIVHLMAAPEARGLSRAVITQSSSGIFRADGALPEAGAAQEAGTRWAHSVQRPALDALRRTSGVELALTGHFGPVRDGRLLTRDTQEVFAAGEQAAVPMLTGFTSDEGAVFASPAAAEALRERSAASPSGAEIEACYPTGPERLRASARAFVGDSRFTYPVWRTAREHARSAPVWLYHFDHRPPLPDGIDLAAPPDGGPGYGVFHTAELPYTGDNLAARDWPWTPYDRDLATLCADAWARFVRDLDPNGAGAPSWGRFTDRDDAPVLRLGSDAITAGPVARAASLHLLDRLPRPL